MGTIPMAGGQNLEEPLPFFWGVSREQMNTWGT